MTKSVSHKTPKHAAAAIVLAAAALASGCVSVPEGSVLVKDGESSRFGLEVSMDAEGSLSLFGHPIDIDDLPSRLIDEGAGKGKAVIIKAHGDVDLEDLENMREYLVKRRIYNVAIVTSRKSESYEDNGETAAKMRPSTTARAPRIINTAKQLNEGKTK